LLWIIMIELGWIATVVFFIGMLMPTRKL